MFNSWQGVLTSMGQSGTAVANSTTETTLLHSSSKIVVPSNFLFYPGQALRIRAMGQVSNIVTTPGTLTLRAKLGPTANIAVASSGALALNVAAKTNVTWILDWDLVLRSNGGGTAATIMFSGQWQSESVIGSPAAGAGGASSHIFPASAPAVGTGFDSTVDNVIDLTAQWSIANAGNTIQAVTFKLESLN